MSVSMTIDEALRTMEATLDPWALTIGMHKLRGQVYGEDMTATVEYAGGEVLIKFTWERNDEAVFTTIYRATEPGPDDQEERRKSRSSIPKVHMGELRRAVGKLKALFERPITTPEKLVAELNSHTTELDPVLHRILKGDWSGVPLHTTP